MKALKEVQQIPTARDHVDEGETGVNHRHQPDEIHDQLVYGVPISEIEDVARLEQLVQKVIKNG